MFTKKYFFFDIDGTLTDDATHKIVPSAKETLKLLQEKGHFVSIATGRAHYKTTSFANHIDVHNLVCFGGGSIVINDEVIDMQALDSNDINTIIDLAEQHQIGYLVMLDDSDKVYMKNDLFLRQVGLRKELTTYILDPTIDFRDKKILKVYLALDQKGEELHSWCQAMPHLRLTPDYFVYQYDAKDIGIRRLMEYFHADVKDVVVFGNDTNDLVMFQKDWTSIAMGNSPDSLKQRATFVTKDNVDDGIQYACEYFHWI